MGTTIRKAVRITVIASISFWAWLVLFSSLNEPSKYTEHLVSDRQQHWFRALVQNSEQDMSADSVERSRALCPVPSKSNRSTSEECNRNILQNLVTVVTCSEASLPLGTWHVPPYYRRRYANDTIAVLKKSCYRRLDLLNLGELYKDNEQDVELFKSCSLNNLGFQVGPQDQEHFFAFAPNLYESSDVYRAKIPCFGVERRTFPKTPPKSPNSNFYPWYRWGVHPSKPIFLRYIRATPEWCQTIFSGVSLLLRVYHPRTLGHGIEAHFRLFQVFKNVINVSRIVCINCESVLPPTFDAFLSLFGVEVLSASNFTGRVCFETGVFVGFPNHIWGRQGTTTTEIQSYRRFLLDKLKVVANSTSPFLQPRITFISRSQLAKSAKRSFVNEVAVVEELRAATNWSTSLVRMEQHTLQEQAAIMQQSTILVSVHSAGFYNMIYMEPGTAVLQLHVPGTHFGTFEYETRPALAVWTGGMNWHLNTERLARQMGMVYAEDWAEVEVTLPVKFVGTSKTFPWPEVRGKERSRALQEWYSTPKSRWAFCRKRKRQILQCSEDNRNEMRAHSVADKLTLNASRLVEDVLRLQQTIMVA